MEIPSSITFSAADLPKLCDQLATKDPDLAQVINEYGYPPFWDRPNSFETLVHIILEQQVSLASARAALEKLRAYVGDITPAAILAIPDDIFKSLYISRQKKRYIQALAKDIASQKCNLVEFETLSDTEVRQQLTSIPGIGNWTVDIYLLMVLHRTDIFPIGDIAVITSLKEIKQLPKTTEREEVIAIAEQWRPLRSIATMLLWHQYLSVRHRDA